MTLSASGSVPTWVKSRRCDTSACVEVAFAPDSILVRNSTNPSGPVLSFTRDEWLAFIGGVRDGDFDLVAGPRSTAHTD